MGDLFGDATEPTFFFFCSLSLLIHFLYVLQMQTKFWKVHLWQNKQTCSLGRNAYAFEKFFDSSNSATSKTHSEHHN